MKASGLKGVLITWARLGDGGIRSSSFSSQRCRMGGSIPEINEGLEDQSPCIGRHSEPLSRHAST